MSSDDPIKSSVQGVAEATLAYSEEKLKQWIDKFKHRQLAFIEKRDLIEFAAQQKKKAELLDYQEYITDRSLILLAQLGISLRLLDEQGKRRDVSELRTRIRTTHGVKNLRIAEFFQTGVLLDIIAELSKQLSNKQEIASVVNGFFRNIDTQTKFIEEPKTQNVPWSQQISDETSVIVSRLSVLSPELFMILAKWSGLNFGKAVILSVLKEIHTKQLDYSDKFIETKNSVLLILIKQYI